MTDNFNVIVCPTPGSSRGQTEELYRHATYRLARAFNHAHPEYSVEELYEKAWDYLNSRHSLVNKTISWFQRLIFGWKDAVRLDFGVHDSLAGGEVWYCMPTYGRVQKCVFVPDGWTYEHALAEVEAYWKRYGIDWKTGEVSK